MSQILSLKTLAHSAKLPKRQYFLPLVSAYLETNRNCIKCPFFPKKEEDSKYWIKQQKY